MVRRCLPLWNRFCETEHLGMVISGNATIAFENEEPKIIGPGDIFYVSNTPIAGLLGTKIMSQFILWVRKIRRLGLSVLLIR